MTKESDIDQGQEELKAASPALWAALSPLARPLRLPANFLPQQTAEARGKTFNATIGQITDGKGRAVPIGAVAEALGGLDGELRNRALLYSPVEGFADLRARWRERQRRGVAEAIPSSLPIATAGPILALSLAADLFLAPGRLALLPDLAPGTYEGVFSLRTGALVKKIPAGPAGLPEPGALSAGLGEGHPGEPVLIAVRCPPPPDAPRPDRAARSALRDALAAAAAARPVVVVVDDLWERPQELGRADGGEGASPFWDLAGLHPNLIAVKVDGADALGFPGGRLGFLTFGFEAGSVAAQALEEKVKILQRAVVGSPSATSQAVLLHGLAGEG